MFPSAFAGICASDSQNIAPHLTVCQHASAHVLTFVYGCGYMPSMSMARIKRHLNLALDPALLDRLDAWIAKQEVQPSKTAVVEAALRAWLDAKGKKP